eukprot:108613-Chlamydomonas_euryale.AAC.10
MEATQATESCSPLSALDTASLAGSAHLRSIIRVVRDMVELQGRQQQQQQQQSLPETASIPNRANHAPDNAEAALHMAALTVQYKEAKAGLQIAFKQMAEGSSGSSQSLGGEGAEGLCSSTQHVCMTAFEQEREQWLHASCILHV